MKNHKWNYSNPYDRTCDVCKEHQIVVSNIGQRNDGSIGFFDVWEVAYPLSIDNNLCEVKPFLGRFGGILNRFAWMAMFVPLKKTGKRKVISYPAGTAFGPPNGRTVFLPNTNISEEEEE